MARTVRNDPASPSLLVSVRSAAEARAALEGGAALIDVKEPSRGSLGRATRATIQAVLAEVKGRRPVSAALGELATEPDLPEVAGLAHVKWGLAGLGSSPDWPRMLARALDRLHEVHPRCQGVVAAYADWRRAQAPPLGAIWAFVQDRPNVVLLVDTCVKDGRTLLDWLPIHEVLRLCARCRGEGVRIALAGSLGQAEIQELLPAAPDWFAVRGAVCRAGDRAGVIDRERVAELARFLTRPTPTATFAG